jgi:transposase
MNREEDRLKVFRALRSEIRGSSEYLVVGVDVAKEKHHAFYGTANGRTLRKRFVFQNRREDFEGVRALARDLATRNGLTKIVYGLEPTGVYHKPFVEYLVRQGEQVVMVSTVAAHRNRESVDGRWDKNDASDSANVADMVGQGRCLFVDDPNGELRELRSAVRTRAQMRKQEHGLRMRIRNHLVAQYFPELEKGYDKGGGDRIVLRVVSECFDPGEIAAMEFDAFWHRLALPRKGKGQEGRVRAIWEGAKQTVGCALDDAVRWEAPALVRRLERLREDMREVERNMTRAAQRLPGYRSVISVPGVGPVLGAMILAAIGDPNRFDHPGQVLRLAGLDLSASRSGKNSERVVPKISKQGKATLRFALVHAALVAVHTNPAVRAYHADLLKGRQQERGIAMKRAVKVAAKLLTVTWTLMCRQEVFDPARFRT